MENVKKDEILNMSTFDPFQDADQVAYNDIIHLRNQKRNGRKCITIIEGLCNVLQSNSKYPDIKVLMKLFKKKLSCNGTLKDGVIQLSGDQRQPIKRYLVEQLRFDRESVVIHG